MRIPNPLSEQFSELRSFVTTEEVDFEIVKMNQIHGDRIVVVNDIGQECEEVDGMVTKLSDVPLAMRVADCGNISCYDPVARVIGLCHAVWKDQLLQSGCVPEHVVISPDCTMCQPEFPSFKRNATNERMMHVVSMRE